MIGEIACSLRIKIPSKLIIDRNLSYFAIVPLAMQAIFGMTIGERFRGATDLSGLNIDAVFRWPGPMHEGKGECAAFVDERANDTQRNTLLTILTVGEPIRRPVDGSEVRAQVFSPGGFEYEAAEIVSRTSRSTVPMVLEHAASYGQFAHLQLDNQGVVRDRWPMC